MMPYTNARQVLPPDLIEQIQEHIDGQLIYIPRKAAQRSAWGSKSGSRVQLHLRNQTIRQAYRRGNTLAELAQSQHLSEDAIRKIIFSGKVTAQRSGSEESQLP